MKGNEVSSNAVTITELDAARIRELGSRLDDRGRSLHALSELIEMVTEEAEIVPASRIAANVVTVNSRVTFRDELTDALHTVTVVYPRDFSIGERRISVLSPVGRALLGRRVGDVAPLDMPDGSRRRIAILELHYQPEASGDDL
jgi:regulator of nucleoside diphosphate kinase